MQDARSAAGVFEPLWERLERNRRRYAALVVVYTVAVIAFFVFFVYSIGAFIPLAIGGALAQSRNMSPAAWGWLTEFSGRMWSADALAWSFAIVAALVVPYLAIGLAFSERTVLRRLGAERVGTGELRETKRALHDLSLARGFDVPPPLYVIDSPGANAAVVGRSPRSGAVAVTRGFVARMDLREQRAVFAHLLSRLEARDTAWATVSTTLMHPLWVWKRRYWDLVPYSEVKGNAAKDQARYVFGYGDHVYEARSSAHDMIGDWCLLFPPYVIAVVIAHYLFSGQREAHLRTAEFADADGLMLLKDPDAALATLEKMIRLDNYVRQAEGQYTQFFYCWTGDDSSNDERDPEWRRIVLLKQTLGAWQDAGKPEDISRFLPPRAPWVEEKNAPKD